MGRKRHSFDVLTEPHVCMKAVQSLIGSNKIAILDHLLQEWPVNLKAVKNILVSILCLWIAFAIFKLGILIVEKLIYLFEGLMTDLPLCVVNSLSQRLRSISIIVIKIIVGHGVVILSSHCFAIIHFLASLVAMHLLYFCNRNIIKVLHDLLMCINNIITILSF